MQYLVQMKLVASGRPTFADDGPTFIAEGHWPIAEIVNRLKEKKS